MEMAVMKDPSGHEGNIHASSSGGGKSALKNTANETPRPRKEVVAALDYKIGLGSLKLKNKS